MNHIIPFEEMKGMADAIAKSKLFGMQTPEQVLALMAIAQAEGLPWLHGTTILSKADQH